MSHPIAEVESHPQDDHLVVAVRGEIDLASAPEIRARIDDALADGWRDLVIDLREVGFMDSSGVHLLDDLRRLGQDGVSCSLVDGVPAVQRVLEVTGMVDVLPRTEPT